MRRAVLHGARDLRIEESPDLRPGPGEVLVRVHAALTCGTDLKIWRRGAHQKFPKPPFPFGHEFAGVIQEIGRGVTGFVQGDAVVAANSAPCGACGPCVRGRPALCHDLLFLNGAFATCVLVPSRIVSLNLLKIPQGLEAGVAALVEPLACALKGMDDAEIRPGDSVAVLGGGPLGLMLARLAVRSGARVALMGKGAERLAAARNAGVLAAVDLLASPDPRAQIFHALGGAPDKVIEAVGSAEAWETALAWTAPGGLALMFGGCPPGTRVPLDAGRLHYEELTVKGSFHHTPAHVREALDFLSVQSGDFSFLVGDESRLEDLPGLFERLDRRELPFKVVVRC